MKISEKMICQKCHEEKSNWEMCYSNKYSHAVQPCKDCKRLANENTEKSLLTKREHNIERIRKTRKGLSFGAKIS